MAWMCASCAHEPRCRWGDSARQARSPPVTEAAVRRASVPPLGEGIPAAMPGRVARTSPRGGAAMRTDSVGRRELVGSGRRAPSVAILGGGVGGMSAAHELVERGFRVTVYEAKSVQGGKYCSFIVPGA